MLQTLADSRSTEYTGGRRKNLNEKSANALGALAEVDRQ